VHISEMSNTISTPVVEGIAPFFIVKDVERTQAFYCDQLGFEVVFREPDVGAFFAILRRGGARLLVKSDANVEPLPNAARHSWMRWDAYVSVPDPDALAAEFIERGARFGAPLADTHDGLRGFEVIDPDGYVLFFGGPR
jgi:catechol 2,3-dioxygenase-like lactoylglutathione lyase family enzyme